MDMFTAQYGHLANTAQSPNLDKLRKEWEQKEKRANQTFYIVLATLIVSVISLATQFFKI